MDKNREAIRLMQERDYEKAAQLFNDIIEEDPQDPIGYINFGNLLVDIGELERAERFFQRAISLDESVATAYYGLGNLYFEQEKYETAIKHLEEAIEKGLEDAHVYYLIGLSFQYKEQFKLALPYLLRATELKPDEVSYLFQYGLSLAQANVVDEAKKVFLKVIEKDETHSDAHYNLGVIALYKDDAKRALEHFETAIDHQPEHHLAQNGKKQVEKLLHND